MKNQIESYVMCEGYHDRAFWAGLLLKLGCRDLSKRPIGPRMKPQDPFGDIVMPGSYAFESSSGSFIRVVPAGGKDKVPPLLRIRLKTRRTKRLARLVVSVDSDAHADGTPAIRSPIQRAQMTSILRAEDPTAIENADGDVAMDGGATIISLVRWEAADPSSRGIPNQHTLERIICASETAAYPARGEAVQNWLDSRPNGPLAGPKSYAWSYMAGWHSDHGSYEGFCEAIWGEPLLEAQLTLRLRNSGILRIAELLSA